jgi:hypothetical protein
MSNEIRSSLSEILPFWFAIVSPLIGIVLGFVAAWFVGHYL